MAPRGVETAKGCIWPRCMTGVVPARAGVATIAGKAGDMSAGVEMREGVFVKIPCVRLKVGVRYPAALVAEHARMLAVALRESRFTHVQVAPLHAGRSSSLPEESA